MAEIDLPRKPIGDTKPSRTDAGRKRIPLGGLKGKPLDAGPRSALVKAPVALAKRLAEGVEQKVQRGRELPFMSKIADDDQAAGPQSLWLRLKVEGKSITVLDSAPVEAPANLPDELRGTAFLEVRSGNELLAARALVDPGLDVGIPYTGSGEPFRGHRIMEAKAYETFILVDLARLSDLIDRSPDAASSPMIEINLVETDKHVGIQVDRSSPLLAASRAAGARATSSATVAMADLLGAGRASKSTSAKN